MSEIDTSKGVRIYKIGAYPNFNSSSLAPNQINNTNLSHLSDADLYDNSLNQPQRGGGKMTTSDPLDTTRSRNLNLVSEKTTPRSDSQTREKVEVYEVNKKRETPRTRSGRVFAIRGTTKTIIEVTTTEVVEDNQFKVAPPSNLTSHRDLKPLDSNRSNRSNDPDKKSSKGASDSEGGDKKKDGTSSGDESSKKKKNKKDKNNLSSDSDSNGLKSKSKQSLDSDAGSRRSQSRNSLKNGSDSDTKSKKSNKSKKSSSSSKNGDSNGPVSSSDPDGGANGNRDGSRNSRKGKEGKLYSIDLNRNKKKPKSNNESTTDTETETTQVKRIGKPGNESDRNKSNVNIDFIRDFFS